MNETERVLAEYVEDQGWDLQSQLDLALRYIHAQDDPGTWEEYLFQMVQIENAIEGRDA